MGVDSLHVSEGRGGMKICDILKIRWVGEGSSVNAIHLLKLSLSPL